MSLEKARERLKKFDADNRIIEFDVSSATVELAAEAVGCEPARIAKTLSFRTNDGVILIVAAGDTKIDNPKYKARFGCKARMLAFEEVEPEIGHMVGGVCPFGVNANVTVYLDESLRRFETVFCRERGHFYKNQRIVQVRTRFLGSFSVVYIGIFRYTKSRNGLFARNRPIPYYKNVSNCHDH